MATAAKQETITSAQTSETPHVGGYRGGSLNGVVLDREFLTKSAELRQKEEARTRNNGGRPIRYGLFGPLPPEQQK